MEGEDDNTSIATADSSLVDAPADPNQPPSPKKKRVFNNFTTLTFIALDGTRTDRPLPLKVQSYSELQREISRLNTGTQQMLVIQDEKGQRIGSQHFVPRSKIIVRELLLTAPKHDTLKGMRYDWEGADFHEVRLQREAEERAEREVEEGISFL